MEAVPILELLEADKYSCESLGEALNRQLTLSSTAGSDLRGREPNQWWLVKSELFALICTRAYAHSELSHTLQNNQNLSTCELLSLLSHEIANRAEVNVDSITPLVATALYQIGKEGPEAWCSSQTR
ncbi:MAG: hypothetical protein JNN07_26900 [Verrucomicrobiales bacterium]|nr:hypothetical protein [Verrucomicrobiales bacterium]